MKKITHFLMALVVVLSLSGCVFFETAEDDMELTAEDLQSADQSAVPAASGGSASGIQTLSIYTVDSIDEALVPLKIPMNTDRITPAFIVDEVIRNMDEKIDVTEIEVEKSRIYVTFNSEYAPIKKCSEEFETLILDCISNSLLDNISYINEVVFQCEDGAYHSDNFTFEKDEIYSSK